MDAIIVNHNSGEALDRCLASILPQADGVVVVDNDSAPEGFEAVVRRHSSNPKLRVLRAGRNTGFSAGCNLGATASRADQLLFLNPDCLAAPRLVETLKGFLDKNPEAGIAGGLLLGEDAKEQGGGRRSKPGLRRAFVRAAGLWRWTSRGDFHLERQGPPAAPQEVHAVSGACLAIRRSVFEKLGGFDEGYFLHCEDLDLCASARDAGWRVVSVPGAVVFHSKGVCGRTKPLFVEWHKHRGMLRYDRKHHRSRVHQALRPATHAAVWLRFALVCARNLAAGKTPPASPGGSGSTPAKPESIGLLGASSFVGRELLALARAEGMDIAPFSRDPARNGKSGHWHTLSASGIFLAGPIARWIALCPITALAGALPLLELAGVRRLVAVSSTSRFTKLDSRDPRERKLARQLESAESAVAEWAKRRDVRLVLLRTTLVYDGLRDANIAAMGRFIRRFQMLPVLFPADGLRQPLHACDLARACLAALRADGIQTAYNLSGGESLPYLEMAGRVFDAAGIPRRFLAVPATLLRVLEASGQVLPRRLRIPASVFHRMNVDMVFKHTAAARDLDFRPRGFRPRIDFSLESAKAR